MEVQWEEQRKWIGVCKWEVVWGWDVPHPLSVIEWRSELVSCLRIASGFVNWYITQDSFPQVSVSFSSNFHVSHVGCLLRSYLMPDINWLKLLALSPTDLLEICFLHLWIGRTNPRVVSWFRKQLSVFSSRMLGFNTGSVHVWFLVQYLKPGKGIPLALQPFRASIISLLLRTCVSFVTRQLTYLAIGRGTENKIQRTMQIQNYYEMS